MNRYCVFLRGINVNGVSIKMAALQLAFETMSYPDAKTVLATGNVVVSLEDGAQVDAHKAKIESGLSATFFYDAHVLLRSEDEISTLLKTAGRITVPEGYHLYVLFIDEPDALASLKEAFSAVTHGPDEQFIPLERDAFWIVPKGETLKTEFSTKVLGNKRFKSVLTSRNVNTLQKVAALMEKRP